MSDPYSRWRVAESPPNVHRPLVAPSAVHAAGFRAYDVASRRVAERPLPAVRRDGRSTYDDRAGDSRSRSPRGGAMAATTEHDRSGDDRRGLAGAGRKLARGGRLALAIGFAAALAGS